MTIGTEQRVGNELFLTDQAIIGYEFIQGCESAEGGQTKKYNGINYTFIGKVEEKEKVPTQKRIILAIKTLAIIIFSFFIALCFSSVREDLRAVWTGKERITVYATFTDDQQKTSNQQEVGDPETERQYEKQLDKAFPNANIINKEYAELVRKGDSEAFGKLAQWHVKYFIEMPKHIHIANVYRNSHAFVNE